MNGLHLLILLSAYLAFCTAFLFGLNSWVSAQSARVHAALNDSETRVFCALEADLASSGLVILRNPAANLSFAAACPNEAPARYSWRPEVVRIAS
ncbi:hypothetical protein HY994_04955 [Candidatus Micrarchaeota archaeon]|nr:hypothetical protein [Candidatus Micrarchaeota archaeon]